MSERETSRDYAHPYRPAPIRVLNAVGGVLATVGLKTKLDEASLLGSPGELESALAHELEGRLTLTMQRLERGLQELDHPELYTEDGLALHRRLQDASTELRRELGRLEQRWDVRNQPYVFDAELFARTNPPR